MTYQILDSNYQKEITKFFKSVFTASEGEKEGALIGNLTSELSSNIDNDERICLGSFENSSLVGSIFFTRLRFEEPIQVYLLAPVAVSTESQRKGIGQKLINHGLQILKDRSVDIVVTYGDPSFYSKVRFEPLSEEVIQAPLKLSMPHGWLGQTLTGGPIVTINGRPSCVQEFNNAMYW